MNIIVTPLLQCVFIIMFQLATDKKRSVAMNRKLSVVFGQYLAEETIILYFGVDQYLVEQTIVLRDQLI
jgi:hypothetical protein